MSHLRYGPSGLLGLEGIHRERVTIRPFMSGERRFVDLAMSSFMYPKDQSGTRNLKFGSVASRINYEEKCFKQSEGIRWSSIREQRRWMSLSDSFSRIPAIGPSVSCVRLRCLELLDAPSAASAGLCMARILRLTCRWSDSIRLLA